MDSRYETKLKIMLPLDTKKDLKPSQAPAGSTIKISFAGGA